MIKAFNHVGLCVSDLDRSIAFYQRAFGMQLRLKDRFGGAPYEQILALPGAHGRAALLGSESLQIELFEFAGNARSAAVDYPVSDVRITHFCVEVVGIEAEYRRLRDSCVRFHCPPVSFGGFARATYGRDPDGNVFELWERKT